MKKCREKVKLIIILIFTCFFSLLSIPKTALADSAFQAGNDEQNSEGHLIVSMVYDDSGSMEGKKGTYCNYTFQLFLSLFGERDELFITYMSKPSTSSNYSIHNNRQARVDNLRAHLNKIFTPVSAIKTAYERLLNEDNGENDTFWLIILTDGLFYDDQKKVVPQEELDRYIKSYANATMTNGKKVNILYVGIGDDVMIPNVEEDNVSIFHATEPEDILNVLDSCGEVFSECIKADNVDFISYVTENNQLHMESALPLQKVILIHHNIGEENRNAVGQDLQGTVLSKTEDVSIYHSYLDYDTGAKELLKGKVTYWEVEDGFIQEGIDLEFDDAIKQDDIIIYVQPAIELNIEYYNEKNEQIELNDCSLEDVLKAKLIINRLDTGEKVNPALIAEKYRSSLLVTDGKKKMRLAEGTEPILIDISMVNEGMIITGSMSFAEVCTYHKVESVALYKSRITSENKFLYDRTKMVGNKEGVILSVTVNETPFTRKDMASMTVHLDTDSLPSLMHLNYALKNDGTMEITPSFGFDNLLGRLFVNWLCVWLIPSDSVEFTIYTEDIFGKVQLMDIVTLDMKKGNIFLEAWYFLYPFLVTGLLAGYIIKNRFKEKQTIYYISLRQEGEYFVPEWKRWSHVSLQTVRLYGKKIKWNIYSMIPYLSNCKRCGVLTVYAAMPFYKKGNAVILMGRDWKCRKLTNMQTSKISEIRIDSKELLSDSEDETKCNTIRLETGEYIYVENKEQRYLYHLGRER
ncbi:MAG: hypothetical protein PUC30_10180 [Lachnospiraceae bacterium]|nr:hypothetical protein [Lachnospiraceae bacterium]